MGAEQVKVTLTFEAEQLVEEDDGTFRYELAAEVARTLGGTLMAAAAGLPVVSSAVSVRGQG